MSKYAENLCDKLIQQIAATARSQYSNYPAECGHLGHTLLQFV